MSNPLLEAERLGQSIWLDYISRHLIDSGELQRLIEEDGLAGVTSNPAIFDKAISGAEDYNQEISKMAGQGYQAGEIYETLAIEDVRRATDLFRPKYDSTQGRHGFVSLEVNPHLAYDTEGTIAEARRLWSELDRPNALIKVPGTKEGVPAIRRLISEGINVNVTLLFGLPRYGEVAEAYIQGLEDRHSAGKPLQRVASVASFFLSRIDVLVDARLEKMAAAKDHHGELALKLRGQVAIASARKAYQIYKRLFHNDRFARLAQNGAASQRLLWASTSTKNPDYSDVKYVEQLIGPETINTLPLETLKAYLDHGRPEARLETGLDEAARTLQELAEVGIDIDQVTGQLEQEGVEKFNKPFDALLKTIEQRQQKAGY